MSKMKIAAEPYHSYLSSKVVATNNLGIWTIEYSNRGHGRAYANRTGKHSSFTYYGNGKFGFERPEALPKSVISAIHKDVISLKRQGVLEE